MSEAVAEKPTAPVSKALPQQGSRWNFLPTGLAIVAVGLLADQLTKLWAIRVLDRWIPVPDLPGYQQRFTIDLIPNLLRFRYAENLGAAFSILHGQVLLLTIISFVASIGLAWFWQSLPPREWWGRTATALIISGAVGNLIDRAFRGRVVDFVDAYIIIDGTSRHWPTFNIADSCICVGAAILMVRLFQGKI